MAKSIMSALDKKAALLAIKQTFVERARLGKR